MKMYLKIIGFDLNDAISAVVILMFSVFSSNFLLPVGVCLWLVCGTWALEHFFPISDDNLVM